MRNDIFHQEENVYLAIKILIIVKQKNNIYNIKENRFFLEKSGGSIYVKSKE